MAAIKYRLIRDGVPGSWVTVDPVEEGDVVDFSGYTPAPQPFDVLERKSVSDSLTSSSTAPAPVWEVVTIGSSLTFTIVDGLVPGEIDVVVTEPEGYAGTYGVDPTEIASEPQNKLAPVVTGAAGEGSLVAQNGLWVSDPNAHIDLEFEGEWVRDGSVPIRLASGLKATARDEYVQSFRADAASPATWRERVKSTNVAASATVYTPYVAATPPATAVANPFASLNARPSDQWAYQDYTHIGGMFTDLLKENAISSYGARPRVVSDKSGNGYDAISVNASNYMPIELIDGIIWDDMTTSVGGRGIEGLSFNGLTEFTLCASVWIREKTGGGTSSYGVMLSRNGSAGLNQSGIYYQHAGPDIRAGAVANSFEFRLFGGVSRVVGVIEANHVPTTADPLIAVVTMRKRSDGVDMWLNGVAGTASTQTDTIVSDRSVGLLNGGGDQDNEDAKIGPWLAAGFALSDSEIAALHAYYMSLVGIST